MTTICVFMFACLFLCKHKNFLSDVGVTTVGVGDIQSQLRHLPLVASELSATMCKNTITFNPKLLWYGCDCGRIPVVRCCCELYLTLNMDFLCVLSVKATVNVHALIVWLNEPVHLLFG